MTAVSAKTAVATFKGKDAEGGLHTVEASVIATGPTVVDLSALGRITALEVSTSSCTTSADLCINDCVAGRSLLAIDNIEVTGEIGSGWEGLPLRPVASLELLAGSCSAYRYS